MRLTLTELQNEGKAAPRPSESAQNVAWRSPVCFLASEEEGEAGRLPRASCFSPSTHQSDVPPSPVWGMEALLRGALLMDGLVRTEGEPPYPLLALIPGLTELIFLLSHKHSTWNSQELCCCFSGYLSLKRVSSSVQMLQRPREQLDDLMWLE